MKAATKATMINTVDFVVPAGKGAKAFCLQEFHPTIYAHETPFYEGKKLAGS